MTDARHDLILMVRLQEIYDRIATAIRERNTPPPEVQELQETNRRRQVELEQFEKQVEQHSEEIREVRRKEAEWQTELEHFQRQKGMVTNEREFTAVISEIDYATKALKETLARREELEAAIEALHQEIEARRRARPEEEAAQRGVVRGWDRRKDELRQEVHDLALDAKRLEVDMAPSNRSKFLRLLESKKGIALSRMVDGSCSVCHFALRPHLQQRIRRAQEIISCEHCHRILYVPDLVEVATPGEE